MRLASGKALERLVYLLFAARISHVSPVAFFSLWSEGAVAFLISKS